MSNDTNRLGRLSRRTVLKASAVGTAAIGMTTPAIGDEHDGDEEYDDEEDKATEEEGDEEPTVDEPDGFEVEVLAPHAPFPDDLTARFCLEYAEDHHGDPIRVDVDDASTVVVAEATWTEDSTSGWHRHPGPYVVNMVEGEIEITHERDCVPRTYAAGDAWFGTGAVHIADSESGARAYVTFLGIPDGEPATEWVPPVEC